MSAERGRLIEEVVSVNPEDAAGFAQCGLNLARNLMPNVNLRPVLAETAVADTALFFHQMRFFGKSVCVVDRCVKKGVLTPEMADKIMAEMTFSLIHDTGKMGIEEEGVYQSLEKMNSEPANKTDSRSPKLKAHHASHVPIGAIMALSVNGLAPGGLVQRGIYRHHETLVKPRSARKGKLSYPREHLWGPSPGALLAPAVDICDAMSHKRVYQNGNPMPAASEIAAEMAGVMPDDPKVNLSVFGTDKDVCAEFRECLVELAEQVRPYYGEPDPNPNCLMWSDSKLIHEDDKRLKNLTAAIKYVWQNHGQSIEEYKERIQKRYEVLQVEEEKALK